MCAAKGFDAVELDDIDSFDPPSTTGFHLTPGDAQNFLSYAMNAIHRSGHDRALEELAAAQLVGPALLRRRGRRGVLHVPARASRPAPPGARQYGFTCTTLAGPRPCGWDDFTTDTTPRQPTGKWVGEDEYAEDGYVCAPGAACTGPHRYSAYCKAVERPTYGFSAMRLDVDLDGRLFQPCPVGR